ncbi:MAG: BREX-1 system phosphatase PglZ type A, partial [Deltaproteobacteria bacterium]|nr:BREX-1 system phosphatase PglZ type A [Deltaproteobacteria bacterium]
MNKISQVLTGMFDRHRIVFWYDDRRELRAEFEALALPGIEKLEIDGNEYALKYRLLRQEPERKFLLYRHGPAPVDLQNWLLDVELSHGVFYADQVTIWLNELGLGPEYSGLVREHGAFFKA